MLVFILLMHFLSSLTGSELMSRQKRNWIIEDFKIEEGHQGPFPKKLGKVDFNSKLKLFFELHGQGVDENPIGVLTIDKQTGIIYVNQAVDYEEWQRLKLRFEAIENENFKLNTRLGIDIEILDINDNPPQFEKDLHEVSIDEDTDQGTQLITVHAHDRDKPGSPNSTFHYNIKSVSPSPPNAEFFVSTSGDFSFKGCLDYEVGEKLTVLVEAIDHGDVVRLSSSTTVLVTIEDLNNHLPTINGQTGTGKVKENQSGVSPLRLQVTDRDKFNTKAWRAKYTIHNDDEGHFKIQTDPETNDGILTVVKAFNYEERASIELSISVENEMPYFYCEVTERSSSGLWKVRTGGGDEGQLPSTKVIITVEDVNDPPEFQVKVKEATLKENSPVGTWVEKVTAVDVDSSYSRDFIYKIGHDPAGWMDVDRHSGDITTVKTPDTESQYVVDGIYTIILHAVDTGIPPMTGTATLHVHIVDVNDNVPKPGNNLLEVCFSDKPTRTNISAIDPDGTPYGGPFKFELLGNAEKNWKLDPSQGFTAGLVKEPAVYPGSYTIDVRISDLQGESGVYTLNVTVCTCTSTLNCLKRRSVTTVGYSAGGIALLTLILFLALLLVATHVSCKNLFTPVPSDNPTRNTIDYTNIEDPGEDCKVPYKAGNPHPKNPVIEDPMYWWKPYITDDWSKYLHYLITRGYKFGITEIQYFWESTKLLMILIQRRLLSIQEVDTYPPDELHHYKEEGDCDSLIDLTEIIPHDDFSSFQHVLEDLGPCFNELAAICKPPQTKH